MEQYIPQSADLLRQGVENGLHLGSQLFILHQGDVIADMAVGRSRDTVAMSKESLLLWLSCTKPIVAMALAQLIEQRRASLSDPVCQYIPEFAQHGKDAITLEHCLTHTGGFRSTDPVVEQPLGWEETIEAICTTRPEPRWEPGEKAGYHPLGSWFILGEVIRRIDGRMPCDYVRDEIFLPLGMNDCWIGIPPEKQKSYGDRIGLIYNTEKIPATIDSYYNTPEGIARCAPPSNGRGPAKQLALFYQMLLQEGELNGKRILKPETVRTWTSPQRVGMMDQTFKHIVDWGYGFKINSSQYGADTVPYGYGSHASQRTFGHSGAQSSCAFVDPEQNLVIVLITNGRPGEARHHTRMRMLYEAIYYDLALVRA